MASNLIGGAAVGSNPGPSWHVEGTGDYNIDQRSDILWQNDNGTPAHLDDERPECAGCGRGRLVQSRGGLAHHRMIDLWEKRRARASGIDRSTSLAIGRGTLANASQPSPKPLKGPLPAITAAQNTFGAIAAEVIEEAEPKARPIRPFPTAVSDHQVTTPVARV